MFTGVGRIVERPNRPTDPAIASRDDPVFAGGTIHIISFLGEILSFNPNPQNCTLTGTIRQTTTVEGGTRLFSGVSGSFADVNSIYALVGRNADGTCNFDLSAAPLLELDTLVGNRTLTL